MSCSRSNSAFANKIKKRLREKINTDLPAAYPRAFTWAIYDSEGMLVVRRSQDDSSKTVDLPEGTPVSAATLGTALTRLLEAAMGFANTVTSSDSPADIVHVAGSKYLFTAARFGTGFVLVFFSYLTAVEPQPSERRGSSASTQTPSSSSKTEDEKTSPDTSPSSTATTTSSSTTAATTATQLVNDEDIAQSTFAGDEPLRKLLAELNHITSETEMRASTSPQARRPSMEEPSASAAPSAQPLSTSTGSPTAPSTDTRARHKSQVR